MAFDRSWEPQGIGEHPRRIRLPFQLGAKPYMQPGHQTEQSGQLHEMEDAIVAKRQSVREDAHAAGDGQAAEHADPEPGPERVRLPPPPEAGHRRQRGADQREVRERSDLFEGGRSELHRRGGARCLE